MAATIRAKGGSEDDARDSVEGEHWKLTEQDEVLAIYRKGMFVFRTKNTTRPHKEIIQGWEKDWNDPWRWGLLGVPLFDGAEVVTIRRLPNGEVTAFRSKAFYGTEAPASQDTIMRPNRIIFIDDLTQS
jgi:hypothetical protein